MVLSFYEERIFVVYLEFKGQGNNLLRFSVCKKVCIDIWVFWYVKQMLISFNYYF